MSEKLPNIPVSMDSDLLAAIDRVAGIKKESRSFVMRSAIRLGLPIVEQGGNTDTISLDGELSADIGRVAEWQKMPRQKVIIEAVRLGLDQFHDQWAYANPEKAVEIPPELSEALSIYNPQRAHDRARIRQLTAIIERLKQNPDGAKAFKAIQAEGEKLRASGKMVQPAGSGQPAAPVTGPVTAPKRQPKGKR